MRRAGKTYFLYSRILKMLHAGIDKIDFLAQTPRGHMKFFQVAWDLREASTMEREERALQAGMRELKIEGEIISLESYLREGIKC